VKKVWQRFTTILFTLLILTAATLIFLLISPKTLSYLAETYAPQYGFSYNNLSGSLLRGLDVEKLSYKNNLLFKHLHMTWNPVLLLDNKISLRALHVQGIDAQEIQTMIRDLNMSSDGNSSFVLPRVIHIDTLALQVDPFEAYDVTFEHISLKGTGFTYKEKYRDHINVDALSLLIDSNITTLKLEGQIKEKEVKLSDVKFLNTNALAVKTVLEKLIAVNIHKKIAKAVEPEVDKYKAQKKNFLPKSVQIAHARVTVKKTDLPFITVYHGDANATNISVNIYGIIDREADILHADDLNVYLDSNLSVVSFHSTLANETIKSRGKISLPFAKEIAIDNSLNWRDGSVHYSGNISIEEIAVAQWKNLDANYTKLLNDLNISYSGDLEQIEANASTPYLNGTFSSDFKNADLYVSANTALIQSYLDLLPKEFRSAKTTVKAHIPLEFKKISPFKANIRVNSELAEVLNPLDLNLTFADHRLHANISAKALQSKIRLDTGSQQIEGEIVLGSEQLFLEGNLKGEITVKNPNTSIQQFMKNIAKVYPFSIPPLKGDATLTLSVTKLKALDLTLRSKHLTYDTSVFDDTALSLEYTKGNLTLKQYRTTFQKQTFFATKPSSIQFSKGAAVISPLWVNDALKVTGRYNFKQQSGELLAFASAFPVSHEMTKLISTIDIQTRLKNGRADMQGSLGIMGGEVYYDLDKIHFASDKDIVVLQEAKKEPQTPFMDKLSTHIKVTSKAPLLYKTPHADLEMDVDLLILKQAQAPLSLLGDIEIRKGSVITLAGKTFHFQKSFIHFTGDPDEPLLKLSVLYSAAKAEISIQIIGSASAPNVTLSSIPYMSKEEITSLLLFDAQGKSRGEENENILDPLLATASGGPGRSLLSTLGISLDRLPIIGKGKDLNQTKKAVTSFFSSEEENTDKREIHFRGAEHVSIEKLQNAMKVEMPYFFQFWKKQEAKINVKHLGTLKTSLQNFYRSEGFYDARFKIRTSKTDVSVSISENRPIRVHSVKIDSDYDIEPFVTLKQGDIFRTEAFKTLKHKIKQQLLQNGYCCYDLDSKAYLDTQKHQAALKIVLKKGELCTFGKITVKGLKSIKDDLILSRLRVKEGEPFNSKKIRESYDALYGLGAFNAISIKYDTKASSVVPLEIIGTEISKPWYFKGGLGYDTDIGFRLTADAVRTNFHGDAKQLSLRLAYSHIEQVVETNYFIPAFLKVSDKYLDLNNNAGYSQYKFSGFQEKKSYLDAAMIYSGEKLTLHTGLALENIDISLLDEQYIDTDFEIGNYLLAGPFFSFRYDSRDSKIDPKYGYFLEGKASYALPYNDQASSYFKYSLEGRAIYTFKDLTLSAVGLVGSIDSIQNVTPESKYFFGGGVNSNRAYGNKRIGITLSPTLFSIQGGSTIENLSLEANYPLLNNLYAALFSDNTLINGDSNDFAGEVISSAGGGLRYKTPIGPLKIDVGWNINDPSQYGIYFLVGQSF